MDGSADDFQSKVSPAVQQVEKEKLEELQSQVRNYEKSIEMFHALKLNSWEQNMADTSFV